MKALRWWLAAALLVGCVGTETGNPPLTAELTVDAHSTDPTRVAIDAPASDATVEGVWVSVSAVGFVGDDECDAPADVMAQLTDLATEDHADQRVGRASFETTERSFCEARLELTPAVAPLPPGAPPELEGATVVLLGQRGNVPFVIVSARADVVRVRAAGDRFAIDESQDGLFLGFDVATWLDGVDLDSGVTGTDGRVLIGTGDNPALAAAFEANLPRGIELFGDADQDGVPDDGAALARGE